MESQGVRTRALVTRSAAVCLSAGLAIISLALLTEHGTWALALGSGEPAFMQGDGNGGFVVGSGRVFGDLSPFYADFTSDGIPEIITPAVRTSPSAPPAIEVWDRVHQTVLLRLTGGADEPTFGWDAAPAGDIDRDGTNDIIVGVPGAEGLAGEARVYSGRTGAEIRRLALENGLATGLAVAGIGDYDGDGLPDLAVSGFRYTVVSGPRHLPVETASQNGIGLLPLIRIICDSIEYWIEVVPTVTVFSADGRIIDSFEGLSFDEGFGVEIHAVGDVSGDGLRDVAVSAPSRDGGALLIYHGRRTTGGGEIVPRVEASSVVSNPQTPLAFFGLDVTRASIEPPTSTVELVISSRVDDQTVRYHVATLPGDRWRGEG